LRIAAHLSGDLKMVNAFRRGEDIHTRTAAEIFNVNPNSVTPNMRRQAKVMNFGILYGMGVLGFQRASGVPRERAKEFIDKYFDDFKGISGYIAKTKMLARKNGFVSTIFGRKRYLPEIKSQMPQLQSQAERIAINMPIQGTASDIIKKAMAEIDNLILSKYQPSDIKMILQIHDELLFEIKNDLVEPVYKEIKKIMENTAKLSVPLIVEGKYGDNWRDMELL
jgi:DNA polymerase-1